jgi:DNA-binding LacI/PurR family transcriptional regulator
MKLSDAPPIPKYWQLAQHFRQQIEQGVLRPGDRLPSLAEMQAMHNASRPTVERAHALLEKAELIERRHGAGVFVATPAKHSTRTQGVIGLCGSGFSFNGYNSYWAQVMGGVREAAAKARVQLLIVEPASFQGWEKADGVIVCNQTSARVSHKQPLGQPLVSLLTPIENLASVVADDYDGARQATEHLLRLGHRKIGFLHFQPKQPVLQQRLAGYRAALKAADVTPRKSWRREIAGPFLHGEQIVATGRAAMQRWIEDGWKRTGCSALLCHNDEVALGAVQALAADGIEVPQAVSIVGFDGTEFCDLASPPLTSVQVPLRAIGAAAVELLLQQIESGELSTEHKVLPTKLKVRASTAPLRS